MITFYFVCKNGSHEEQADEEKEIFELEIPYQEGLDLLRGIKHTFRKMINSLIILRGAQ